VFTFSEKNGLYNLVFYRNAIENPEVFLGVFEYLLFKEGGV